MVSIGMFCANCWHLHGFRNGPKVWEDCPQCDCLAYKKDDAGLARDKKVLARMVGWQLRVTREGE